MVSRWGTLSARMGPATETTTSGSQPTAAPLSRHKSRFSSISPRRRHSMTRRSQLTAKWMPNAAGPRQNDQSYSASAGYDVHNRYQIYDALGNPMPQIDTHETIENDQYPCNSLFPSNPTNWWGSTM